MVFLFFKFKHILIYIIIKNVETDIYINICSSYLTCKILEDVEKEDFIKEAMNQFETKKLKSLEFIKTLVDKDVPKLKGKYLDYYIIK